MATEPKRLWRRYLVGNTTFISTPCGIQRVKMKPPYVYAMNNIFEAKQSSRRWWPACCFAPEFNFKVAARTVGSLKGDDG